MIYALVAGFIVLNAVSVLCSVEFNEYVNTSDPAAYQLYEFRRIHPMPIGILTTSSGQLVELRESSTLNSDAFSNQYHIDLLTSFNNERIPERVVHAKAGGAFGYFEVTHDVSKYTKVNVFNGIGRKTPVFVRLSTVLQNLGGSDIARDVRGMAVKFYTSDGNFDLLTLNAPVFFNKDPVDFPHFVHSAKRNPKTHLFDFTQLWDFITKKPEALNGFLYVLSDYGIPNGFRKMDTFAIHTFVINNKHGDQYFVRFNFRTKQGLEAIASDIAVSLRGRDPDYFNRDLYNSIENKNYPAWTIEMDVLTLDDIKKVDYDPFDVTRMWKKGTYFTVNIGKLVLNRNPDNYFSAVEQSAFNPGNLVPGILGPMDYLFRSRRSSYRDTQVYRLGVNHNRIEVNKPIYCSVYDRDGVPPVGENMKDAPNYYPNSFNGPVPYIDPSKPKVRYTIYESNAVDLEPTAYFYNHFLYNDAQRERLVNNTVPTLVTLSPQMQRRVIRLLTLTEPDLGIRIVGGLKVALETPSPSIPLSIKISRQQRDEKENQVMHKNKTP